MLLWILLFTAQSLFWVWILFRGGAEWLEGSFLSALLLHSRASRWSADGIKMFAGCTWFLQGVWFVVGLFYPGTRLLSYLG